MFQNQTIEVPCLGMSGAPYTDANKIKIVFR